MSNPSLVMKKCYVFDNQMVMAFDQFGQQMPDYQGLICDVQDKIRRDYPEMQIKHGAMR